MELFRVFGTIGLEDGEAKKKLRDIDSEAQGLTGKLTKTGVAIGTAFGNLIAQGVMKLGSAIVGIGPSLVQSAAGAQALGAQFEQVFGDAQKDAQTLIDGLGKDFGMVPNRIKPAMTQMTSMFKGLGMDTEDAMGTAKDAVTMVADAAAFYDKSFEDANSALNSFIKGNYEGGESIGLFANETQLAAWASKELGKDWKTLDEAGKQVARLEYAKAMQESAGATGQAARESDSLENQLGNLRQVWDDLKAKFGAPILAPAVAGIQKLSEWLQGVDTSKVTDFFEWAVGKLPIVQGVFSQAFGVIKDVANQVWEFFQANILPIFTQWFTELQANLPIIQQNFKTVFDAIVEVATTVWDFFKKNILPIFVSLFTWVQGHMPTIRATFQTVFTKVVEVASKVWAFFKDNILPILSRFLDFIQKNMPTIQRIVENVFKIIADVVKVVWDIFENLLLPALKALWDYIVAPAFSKIQTIIEKVFGGIFKAVDAVAGAFEAVTDAVKKAIDWLTSWNNKKVSKKTVQVEEKRSGGASAAFATGTNFAPGGTALVGERGPEIIELPRGSKVKTANRTKQLLNNDGVKELKLEAPIYLDGYQIAKAVFPTIDLMQGNKLSSNMRLSGVKG